MTQYTQNVRYRMVTDTEYKEDYRYLNSRIVRKTFLPRAELSPGYYFCQP